MKTFFVSVARLVALTALLTACEPKAEVGKNGKTLDVAALADSIEASIKPDVMGYQIVIFADGSLRASRAGGNARRAADAPQRKMDVGDKINVASVSKTVTAAALLHALNAKAISIDSPLWSYLPKHWPLHSSIQTITFRQLLAMRSGFPTNVPSDYASLKAAMTVGATASRLTYSYQNMNYALMRFLIPGVAGGHAITPMPANASTQKINEVEQKQAQEYTDAYMDYCQVNVFDKIGLAPNMACKPTDVNPALCYKWASPNGKGTDWGDMSLTNAERGWNMSALQMATFMNALHHTYKILPKSVADGMRRDTLGYDKANIVTSTGLKYVKKNGGYPAALNAGEVGAWLFGFENEVYVAVLVNSDPKPGTSVWTDVVAAFDAWYN
jgi:CubicO group peptidase (beta-lactamase class C family)